MALAFPHLKFLLEVAKAGVITGPIDIMEFGEQQWFGDMHPKEILAITKTLNLPPERVATIEKEFNEHVAQFNSGPEIEKTRAMFKFAKLFYKTTFNAQKISAIDLHGTDIAINHDLNTQFDVKEQFDLLTNLGTGEHVFNQYMFFKNMHELTKTGGFMLHSFPNQGCYDHGFFNYHPTFVFDLADANKYQVVSAAYVDLTKKPALLMNIDRKKYVEMAVQKKLSDYSALLVLFKKTSDEPFAIPQQGYYTNNLPDDLRKAWQNLDR